MRHFMKYLLTVSLVVSGLFYTKRSQAFVGAAAPVFNLASVLWIVGGIAAAGTGAYAFNVADGIDCDDFKSCSGRYGLKFLGAVLVGVGIIALDEKATSSVAVLNIDNKVYYNLTDEEFSSFNSEIDEINAIIQTAASNFSAELEKGSVDSVVEFYERVNKTLSKDTLSALAKIQLKIQNELNAKKASSQKAS